MPACASDPSLSTRKGGRQVNGPMQHRLGHECALCDAHSKAAQRHTARPHVRTKRYLPWIAPLALCVVLTPFVDGAARGLFIGIAMGLAAGAGLAWLMTRVNRHIAATTLASATDELRAEADQRVAMVIRQFEWAVNDVANLRDALKRAQDARAAAEASALRIRKHAHRLEAQLYEARVKIGEYSRALGNEPVTAEDDAEPETDHLVVPVVWRVFEENELQWLRLESAGIALSQVRLLNSVRTVIAIRAKAIDPADVTRSSLVLRVPDEVRVALEHQA